MTEETNQPSTEPDEHVLTAQVEEEPSRLIYPDVWLEERLNTKAIGERFTAFESMVSRLLDAYRARGEMIDRLQDNVQQADIDGERIDAARAQRDFLGAQLSDRVARLYALRVAFGDTTFDQAGHMIRADLAGIEANLKIIAQQHGVEA